MWGDALQLLVHIINATPTSALPDVTPYEAWYGCKPVLGMLCTFGCTAYVHMQKDERNGLQPRSQKCIYLSFENGYKGWCCLDPITKHTIISCDIIFNEMEFPGLSTSNPTKSLLKPAPIEIPHEAAAPPDSDPDPEPPEADHEIHPPPIPEHPDPNPDLPAPPDPAPTAPPMQPCWSERAPSPPNYQYLNDLLLRPQPHPDHDDPGPEGGAAAKGSIIQVLEFIHNGSDVTGAKLTSPDTIEMTFNATIKDDCVPKMFAEAMQHSDVPLWKDSTVLKTEISGADNGVAESDGSDVRGTWLQLVCCALPKHLCP